MLLLAVYLDNHLSLLEDSALERALEDLGWQPGQQNDVCIITAFSRAREAASSELHKEAFLQTHVNLLKERGDAITAFGLIAKVIRADGVSPTENRFLHRLRKLLFE